MSSTHNNGGAARLSCWWFRWLEFSARPGHYVVTFGIGSPYSHDLYNNHHAVVDDFGNLVRVQ